MIAFLIGAAVGAAVYHIAIHPTLKAKAIAEAETALASLKAEIAALRAKKK